MDENKSNVIELTADIVSAYAANNSFSSAELPNVIKAVHDALSGVQSGAVEAPAAPQTPAVNPRKSINPDYLICLEDGRRFKSLKRHLRSKYNLSPEEYRSKWNLPKDYPMVAPNYAASRSALAKSMGLGQGGRKAAAAPTRGRKASGGKEVSG